MGMHDSSTLKEYKKKVLRKKLTLIGAGALLAGMLVGSIVGSLAQRQRSANQVKKVVEEVKAEEQKKIEQIKQELFQEQEADEIKELPWNLILVNSTHPMQEGYVPELEDIGGGHTVDRRIADAARRMLNDAKEQGMNIVICSAYRSVEKQEQVFNSSVQDRLNMGMNYWQAYRDTGLSVANPGTSEHGIGLALDLISSQYSELDERQAETKEAKWLEENCYKYGFILRYPPEKTVETGIIYEPWHYRYVGEEDAKKIMESKVTLETYLKENF